MCASHVKVTYALTYEQADDLMVLHAEAEPELNRLSQLTDKLLAWRKVRHTRRCAAGTQLQGFICITVLIAASGREPSSTEANTPAGMSAGTLSRALYALW